MRFTKYHSIQSKLIYIILSSTFLIAFIIVSICYTSFHKLLKGSLIESTTANLHLTMNSLSSNMAPIINFSNWCSNKSLLTTYLSRNNVSDSSADYSTWLQLKEEYLSNASSHYLSRVVIGNTSSHYLHISSVASFNAFNLVETVTHLPYFNTLYESKDLRWTGIVADPFSDDSNAQMIPIIRPIYSPYNTSKIGWCYLSVATSLLTHTLSNETIPSDSKLLLTINDHTYNLLSDSFEEIQYTSSASHSYQKDGALITTLKDASKKTQTYITISSPTLKGWYLTQSLSQLEFKKQQSIYILLMLFIGLSIVAVGITLTFCLDYFMNQPLNKVLKKVNALATGDFSYDSSIEWPNEFGAIGKELNRLSTSVVELMENRVQAEKHEKELEYQMLQSQINPHFLYNTLNSIKWMATIQKATGIAEMTTALSRLMRSISKDTQQIVSLKDEIHLLDNYFLIQQYRYGGTISLHYEIDDVLKACQILKFTLQPIVENAIFHGIEPKGESGSILIKAYKKSTDTYQEALCIEITDDGVGMDQQQVDRLLSCTSLQDSHNLKKIGLNNVHERIRYTFGSEYGLHIDSQLNLFTTVSILIPYKLLTLKEDHL